MKFKKGKTPLFLITLGTLLLFTSILIQTGPTFQQGPWRLYPKDLAHTFGWIGTAIMTVSSAYPRLKRGFMKGMRRRFDMHCVLGIASLSLIVVHLYQRLLQIRAVHMVSFFTFGFMFIITASGVIRRFRSGNGYLKAYSQVFHVPLSIAFYITLGYHVMHKLAVI